MPHLPSYLDSAVDWYYSSEFLKKGVLLTCAELGGLAIQGRDYVAHGQQIDEQLEALRLGYG